MDQGSKFVQSAPSAVLKKSKFNYVEMLQAYWRCACKEQSAYSNDWGTWDNDSALSIVI